MAQVHYRANAANQQVDAGVSLVGRQQQQHCPSLAALRPCDSHLTGPLLTDRHHFDNPVYSTAFTSPVSPEPLNNTRINNKILKNTNCEREREAAAAAAYLDEDDQSDCVSERGFGCTGNAFGYSSLHRRKWLEADYANPNLAADYGSRNIYTTVNDIKDNRQLENVYDEIQKRISAGSLKPPGDKVAENMTSYDRLDFSRPVTDLRPQYQSTSTLRSRGSQDIVEEQTLRREADSGISSARSTATTPWSGGPGSAQSTGTRPWSGPAGGGPEEKILAPPATARLSRGPAEGEELAEAELDADDEEGRESEVQL